MVFIHSSDNRPISIIVNAAQERIARNVRFSSDWAERLRILLEDKKPIASETWKELRQRICEAWIPMSNLFTGFPADRSAEMRLMRSRAAFHMSKTPKRRFMICHSSSIAHSALEQFAARVVDVAIELRWDILKNDLERPLSLLP